MLPKYEVLAKEILYFPNALANPEQVIDFLENSVSAATGNWVPWISHGDSDPHQYGLLKEVTPHKLQFETDHQIKEQATLIINSLYDALDSCYLAYYQFRGVDPDVAEAYVKSYKKDRPSHIAIKKYFDQEALGPHPDWEESDPVVFTASMYFNDGYSGGDLNFPEEGVSVKPAPGSVVVFPSKALHESLAASGEPKYVTNALGSLPKDLIERLLLP